MSLAVAETTSWGILYYSFNVLLAPFETAFAASRVTLSGAFSLALLTSGLAARPVGHSLERWGVRHVMTLGALLGIVSYGLLAIVTNLTALYLVCAKRIRSSARKNKTDDASQYPARVFELTCDDLAQAHGSAHSETDS